MIDTRWERWAAASGVVFVVLAVVAFLFAYDSPTRGDTSEAILSYFNENDTAIAWQAFVFGLSAIAFIWFVGTLAATVRRAENDPAGRLPAIIVTAGATSAGLFLAGTGANLALANSAGEIEAATARTVYEIGAGAFTITDFTAATLVLAVALAVVRTALLPVWTAYLGVTAAAILIVDAFGGIVTDSDAFGPGSVFGTIAFLVFLAWTLVTSALLAQRVGAEVPTARMAPT